MTFTIFSLLRSDYYKSPTITWNYACIKTIFRVTATICTTWFWLKYFKSNVASLHIYVWCNKRNWSVRSTFISYTDLSLRFTSLYTLVDITANKTLRSEHKNLTTLQDISEMQISTFVRLFTCLLMVQESKQMSRTTPQRSPSF